MYRRRIAFAYRAWTPFLFVLMSTLLSGCSGTSNKPTQLPEVHRGKRFVLEHISADRVKAFLSELDCAEGVTSNEPNVVFVDAAPADMPRVTATITLVDSNVPYAIEKLVPVSEVRGLPTNSELARLLGHDVTIGTFADPPGQPSRAQGIVDIHRDHLVAILPATFSRELIALTKLGPAGVKLVQGQPTSDSPLRAGDPNALPTKGTAASAQVVSTLSVVETDPDPTPSESALPRPRGHLVMAPAPMSDVRTPVSAPPPGDLHERVDRHDPGAFSEENLPPKEVETSTGGPSPTSSHSAKSLVLPNADERLQLDLPSQLELTELLDLVGEYLELDYLYDPGKLKGQMVTLKLHGRLRGEMQVRDLYALMESVLKFKGFAMTRHAGNLVTIVPAAEAMEIDPDLIDAPEASIDAGDMVVTRVFSLQTIGTSDASTLLQGMKLSLSVTPVAGTGDVIVTCYAHQIQRIEQLLQLVDKPGRPKEFRFRQLRYTMAKSLADKVKELASKAKGVSVSMTFTGSNSAVSDRPRPLQNQANRASLGSGATGEEAQEPVHLDADERTNRIVMIGYAEQLDLVEELIDALDVAQQDLRVLKVYDIRHVEAGDVKDKLQELEIVAGSTSQAKRTGAGKIASAEIVGGTLAESPQWVVLEATNSIAINATEEQHQRIEAILGYLDVEVPNEAIPYEIYFLENQEPDSLASMLEKIVHETVLDPEGKSQSVLRTTDDRIVIVPDKDTFSLIVYANKKNQDWISKLVTSLDKRRPQVLIDVTLVEIRKTDEFNYDLDLVTSLPDLGEVGDPFADFQVSGGGVTAFYADKHVNALLTAIQAKNYGRVLARPKVLVNDNEKGTIQTTETTYVIKTSSIPVTSGTAGDQSNLIETAVDYQGYDAGITLDITPHISVGDWLRLEIILKRSDFGTITGERPPDQTSTDITTVVTAPDSSTIILGGMFKLNQSKGGNKVPILGDLPVLGGAFRSISNSDIQNRLYVFVRAEIIRPTDAYTGGHADLERISEQNRDAFEKHEQEFQTYHSWPGTKSKPVDPVKVLEAQ